MLSNEAIAEIIMLSHALLIFLVFAGILISVRIKRFRPIEALFLLSAVIIWSLYGACPLTAAEVYFREAAGQHLPLMELGFIAYYLQTWFHWEIAPGMITAATYTITAIFLFLTVEWELPLLKKFTKRIRS